MGNNVEEERDGNRLKIFRDIRRYYCEYCGICRSKKSLIRSHLLSHHQDEMEDSEGHKSNTEKEGNEPVRYTCQECGASFRKPAYLKQHMQGHSFERPFVCKLKDCYHSYRRKDHLMRHMLKHQGKLFVCLVENCNHRFAFQGNMTRHLKDFHDGHAKDFHDSGSPCEEGKQHHICQEVGCGKTFKYPSKLKKHEDSHVKLDYVEVVCGTPGCMKSFTNAQCLKAHIESCHKFIKCEVCGTQQLKKNIKRHQRVHEGNGGNERIIKCSFRGCQYTYSRRSNLIKHVKAIHEELRPFTCRVSGCGQKFTYRHVRDKHEKSSIHTYAEGDFIEADEQFRSRPRGGRKRKCLTVETLTRKRIAPLDKSCSVLDDGTEYLRWLIADDDQQQ